METLSLLGIALGFATLSGVNLYLITFLAGLTTMGNRTNSSTSPP
jgi:hypothetical protein